jgi:ABC-2 type transport system permease protein
MMESSPAAIRLKPEITAYLQLYFRLISSRIRSQMQYRLSFLLDVVGNFFGNFTDLAALMVMFTQARSLGGWSFGEIAFLYGLSSASFALHELFQGAFDNDVFASYIQRGLFDQMLIRPLPTFFQMMTEYFMLRRLGRMTQGLIALGLGIALAQPHWTFAKLLYLPVVIAGGALFFLAISIAGCTLCFWTVQSTEVVNIFTYGGTTMLQYPLTIYQEWMQKFFVYVLPMAFINYFPTLYFLDKPDLFHLPPFVPFLAPVVCVAVFLLSLRIWQFGVAHYTSTGS